MDKINPDAAKLAQVTFALLTSCQEKEQRLAEKYELTQAEFRLLRIFDLDEKVNNKHLAEKMGLSQSRLTRILDGLVKKEYLEREIDSEDRRNMIIVLTKNGKNIVHKLNQSYLQIHDEILKDIDKNQHKPLISGMQQLLSALEKWIKSS